MTGNGPSDAAATPQLERAMLLRVAEVLLLAAAHLRVAAIGRTARRFDRTRSCVGHG